MALNEDCCCCLEAAMFHLTLLDLKLPRDGDVVVVDDDAPEKCQEFFLVFAHAESRFKLCCRPLTDMLLVRSTR